MTALLALEEQHLQVLQQCMEEVYLIALQQHVGLHSSAVAVHMAVPLQQAGAGLLVGPEVQAASTKMQSRRPRLAWWHCVPLTHGALSAPAEANRTSTSASKPPVCESMGELPPV